MRKSDVRRKLEKARRMMDEVIDLIDEADPDEIWMHGSSSPSAFMGDLDDAIDRIREYESVLAADERDRDVRY